MDRRTYSRIVLGAQDCFELSQTSHGIAPLNNPFLIKTSSKDPHRGLYPRVSRKQQRSSSFKHVHRVTNFSQVFIKMNDQYSNGEFNKVEVKKKGDETDNVQKVRNEHESYSVKKIKLSCNDNGSLSLPGCSGVKIFDNKQAPNSIDASKSSFSHGFHSHNQHAFGSSVQSLPGSSDSLSDILDMDYKPWNHSPQKRKANYARNYESPSKMTQPIASPSPKSRNKKMLPVQKNTLFNYFEKSPLSSPDKTPSKMNQTNDNASPKGKLSCVRKNLNFVDLTFFSDSNDGSSVEEMSPLKSSEYETKPNSTNVSVNAFTSVPMKVEGNFNEKSKSINLSTLIEDDSDVTDLSDNEEKSLKKELNDIYGLVSGMSWDWDDEEVVVEEKPSIFSLLPVEIIENIFCQLPLIEMCLNLTLVCKQWSEIISNKNFMHWKKVYYKMKYGIDSEKQMVSTLCETKTMNSNSACLQNLIRFVRDFRKVNPSKMANMHCCLKYHPKYKWAEAMLIERLPECIENEQPNPWSVIAALCILSHSVKDVCDIISCLTSNKSSCLMIDVLEYFYCLATLFFYFRTEFKISSGYHYRVYYALYLFENKGAVTSGDLKCFTDSNQGQQSIRRYGDDALKKRLTHEQKQIVNHKLKQGDVVKIVAFAGTGKTTTLIELTQLWPSKKFLNVVFNKATCDFAKLIFPKNVTCKTVHSIAYGEVGKWYRSKLNFTVKALDYVGLLEGENKIIRAGVALKTIEKFCSTDDQFITIAHVPEGKIGNQRTNHIYSEHEKLEFCNDAIFVWKKMKNRRDFAAKITHDVYLKLYQLENMSISGYDCILLDEAQDYSAAMLSIFMRQSCPKIIVGDPHQQIYAFRGAIKALDVVQATRTYYLTQSFRFGPEIGFLASITLDVLKNETRKTIVGVKESGGVNGKQVGQMAIIARSNLKLFAEAVRICCLEDQNIHGAFLGGLRAYSFDLILDIYKMMLFSQNQGTKESLGIKSKFIARFKSFETLINYADQSEDVELQSKIKIVQTYNSNLPDYIEKIKRKCSYSTQFADTIFTTAHKSKGQEFDTVFLTDDYLPEGFMYRRPHFLLKGRDPDFEEANVLYVAITRAKHQIILSPTMMQVLLLAGERFEYPYSLTCFQDKDWFTSEQFKCISCCDTRPFQSTRALMLYREKVELSNGKSIKEGPLCALCSYIPYFRLSEFIMAPNVQCIEYNHESLSPLLGPLGKQEIDEAIEMLKLVAG